VLVITHRRQYKHGKIMAANKQLLSSSTLALVFIAKLYAMQPFSAAQSTSPAIPSAAG
jgi:hypothetical protein